MSKADKKAAMIAAAVIGGLWLLGHNQNKPPVRPGLSRSMARNNVYSEPYRDGPWQPAGTGSGA